MTEFQILKESLLEFASLLKDLGKNVFALEARVLELERQMDNMKGDGK